MTAVPAPPRTRPSLARRRVGRRVGRLAASCRVRRPARTGGPRRPRPGDRAHRIRSGAGRPRWRAAVAAWPPTGCRAGDRGLGAASGPGRTTGSPWRGCCRGAPAWSGPAPVSGGGPAAGQQRHRRRRRGGLRPRPGLAKVERLLALAWASGARPLLVLAKADMVRTRPRSWPSWRPMPPAWRPSRPAPCTGEGVERLRAAVGTTGTLALLGSSGAGKSSLVNALVGAPVLRTRRIRADGRGRHTSVRRELVPLPGGGCVDRHPGAPRGRAWPVRMPAWRRSSPTSRSWPPCAASTTARTRPSPGARCPRRSSRARSRCGGWRPGADCSASWPGWRGAWRRDGVRCGTGCAPRPAPPPGSGGFRTLTRPRYGRSVSDDRRRPTNKCEHEWVRTGTGAGQSGRTLGSRCVHCGRYSYRPSPPPQPPPQRLR